MEYREFDKKHYVVKKGIEQSNYIGEHGKSRADFKCPFCSNKIQAYIFSIHGGGKKCSHCDNVVIYVSSAWKKFSTKENALEFIKNNESESA